MTTPMRTLLQPDAVPPAQPVSVPDTQPAPLDLQEALAKCHPDSSNGPTTAEVRAIIGHDASGHPITTVVRCPLCTWRLVDTGSNPPALDPMAEYVAHAFADHGLSQDDALAHLPKDPVSGAW